MELERLHIDRYITTSGKVCEDLEMTYEIVGRELHTAPVIVVNHALTGNSDVSSTEKGWWKDVVGYGKVIDLDCYTVLTINIPGNGYDGSSIEDYQSYACRDVAALFLRVLDHLKLDSVYAIIGSSLGGGIAWEMLALKPEITKYLIPIASDWKSTAWIIGMTGIQDDILNNSSQPIHDARKMAMLFYRTPQSMNARFGRSRRADDTMYNVCSWLDHHGRKLAGRFEKSAYLMMNHLLSTIDTQRGHESLGEAIKGTRATIVQIAVDSDILFTKDEIWNTKLLLDKENINNTYHEIQSIHGHDAFLIEYDQLEAMLKPIFEKKEKYESCKVWG